MFIEIWERLRGYDTWIEAEATIKSSKIEQVVRRKSKGQIIFGWDWNKEIAWVDQAGIQQSEMFEVKDSPFVFKMHDRSRVFIRYNPISPSDFYIREHIRYQVSLAAKITLALLAAIGALLVIVRI